MTVTWREDLAAICLKWQTEYDAEDRVQQAVRYALDHVAAHGIRHWWVDLSTSARGLKAADQHWVEGDFGRAVAESTLQRLAMTPPLPETGQETGWIREWEAATNARYRGRIEARLVTDEAEVRAFFGA